MFIPTFCRDDSWTFVEVKLFHYTFGKNPQFNGKILSLKTCNYKYKYIVIYVIQKLLR